MTRENKSRLLAWASLLLPIVISIGGVIFTLGMTKQQNTENQKKIDKIDDMAKDVAVIKDWVEFQKARELARRDDK